eukprot:1181047-Prorocentrum_minimum.AAC.2
MPRGSSGAQAANVGGVFEDRAGAAATRVRGGRAAAVQGGERTVTPQSHDSHTTVTLALAPTNQTRTSTRSASATPARPPASQAQPPTASEQVASPAQPPTA